MMACCPQCGKEAAHDAKFCAGCGARLDTASQEPSGPVPGTGARHPPPAVIADSDTVRLLNAIAGLALLAFGIGVLTYYGLPIPHPFHRQTVDEAGHMLQLMRSWQALPVAGGMVAWVGGILLLFRAFRGR